MEVSPTPPVPETEILNEYTELIEQGLAQSEQAKNLRAVLENTYGDTHRVLRDADRRIRFQSLKSRN